MHFLQLPNERVSFGAPFLRRKGAHFNITTHFSILLQSEHTIYALIEAGLLFDSSQALYWKQASIRDRPLCRFEQNRLPVKLIKTRFCVYLNLENTRLIY